MAEARKTRPVRFTDAEWTELKRRGLKWLRDELANSAFDQEMDAHEAAMIRIWYDGEQIRTETIPAKEWHGKGE